MDISGSSNPSTSPFPSSSPSGRGEKSPEWASGNKSRSALSRVASRWWQILLVWLMVSPPICLLVYLLDPPTYEAVSLLRIEPATFDLFSPLNRQAGEPRNLAYLQTQVRLITSAVVLDPAIGNPLVLTLPLIQKSVDPKSEFLQKLKVEIVENTNLIRISLELPSRDDAVIIVQSVVQCYLAQNADYRRSANRELTEILKQQLVKIGLGSKPGNT